jgi:hypothetical protein
LFDEPAGTVGVRVDVGVRVGVGVRVEVGLPAPGVEPLPGVSVGSGVCVGVAPAPEVGVPAAVSVGVAVGVFVGVFVAGGGDVSLRIAWSANAEMLAPVKMTSKRTYAVPSGAVAAPSATVVGALPRAVSVVSLKAGRSRKEESRKTTRSFAVMPAASAETRIEAV